MKEEELYKYCPKCGDKALEDGKIAGLKCSNCDFDFFLNPKPSCMVAIFDDTGKIMLTKRAINPFKGWWDLPGGFINKGESAEETIKRELREELGIDAKIKDYFSSNSATYKHKETNLDLIDLTFICTFKGVPKPEDDVSDYRFFSKDQLPAKIVDSPKGIIEKLIQAGILK